MMTDEDFLSRVQRDLSPHDTGATEASAAVLRTLAEGLSADQARALSDRLPPGLRRHVTRRHSTGGGQHAVGYGD